MPALALSLIKPERYWSSLKLKSLFWMESSSFGLAQWRSYFWQEVNVCCPKRERLLCCSV